MYIPRANEEKRLPVLQDLMRAHSFATLVTVDGEGILASHLPMTFEQDGSEFGILKCHVARGNSQWRNRSPTIDALAIFAGDHHYISASWYPEAATTGAEVPTWNYVVVHAYGPLRVMSDEQLHAHLESLTNQHESAFQNGWKLTDAPAGYIASQMRAIVGLELPIRRIEGKWKVSQNRNERDRTAVLQGLAALNTPESLAMKSLVESNRPPTTDAAAAAARK